MTPDATETAALTRTVGDLIRRHAVERPDAVLLASDEARLTYGAADQRSRRIARGLLASGVTKGSHVGLLLPNGADFIVHFLAAARIGAVVLPFSTLSKPDELRGLLVRSDTGFLVTVPQFRGQDFARILTAAFPGLDGAAGGGETILRDDAPWLRRIWFADAALDAAADAISEAILQAVEASVRPSDRLVIIHTSGSTSQPKGVIHQHGTLIRHLETINAVRRYGPDDALYSTAPWFWVAGFGYGLLGTLVAGARIIQSNARDAPVVLDLLERERPTITNGYGPSVGWLAADPSFADRDVSWLRRGNLYAIMAPDVRPADASLRHDIYGTSETGSALTMIDHMADLPERQRGACGKLLPGWEAKIVDPETGRPCATGEVGELWVRGPLMMEGYYGRPREAVFEPDGWWRSSDAFAIDGDGVFILKGRLGSMIKTAGANVAPREVESVMGELTGGAFSVVLGLPDAKKGQVVIGVVFTDGVIDEDELRRRLGERLSGYKVPRRILTLRPDAMPTLSSGKIDSRRLLEVVQDLLAAKV